jgi:hypothetical protein
MNRAEDGYLIDDHRTACLCDVGTTDYIAVTAVAADGSAHLVMARVDAVGDESVGYDASCPGVAHEQLGPLPLNYTRRIAVSRRTRHRCGRRTQAGAPCRIRVTRAGDACEWHRDLAVRQFEDPTNNNKGEKE